MHISYYTNHPSLLFSPILSILLYSSFVQPTRLYTKGTILGYRRGRRNTYHNTSLLKLDGVQDTDSAKFYFGKKVAFIYKAKVAKNGSKFRSIWGKVTCGHGNDGVVRAKFAKNLDPKTIGSSVRVMLYPSAI